MANMHLVTGYAGQEHVTAADQGVFHSYLFGEDQFVFDRGNKLAANIESNNLIRVLDGDIYMKGRHVRLNESTYVDLTIENGEQGMQRNDLIVARYTKDSMTSVEEVNLVVIKGTASVSNPADPAHTEGDIFGGALLHDMPLYRVPLDGLNVGELVPLFTVNENKTILDKQDRTNILTEETKLADEDAIPFFDASANEHRKVLWSNFRKHEHSAEHIKSGILPVERGGTGVSRIVDLKAAFGSAATEYVWEKTIKTTGVSFAETAASATICTTSSGNTYTFYYADSYVVNSDNTTVTLQNPKTLSMSYNEAATSLNVMIGKWYIYGKSSSDTVNFLPSNTTITRSNAGSGSYYFKSSEGVIARSGFCLRDTYQHIDYCGSNDPNAYPPSVADGYTYIPYGQIGGFTKIEKGSYVGTGTYGESNTNMLEFSFEPKLVLLHVESADASRTFLIPPITSALSTSTSYKLVVAWRGRGVTWYCSQSAAYQFNTNGTTYHYVAIG